MKILSWFKENYSLTIILLVSAILRLYHADFQSIWLDEILTMNDSNPKLTISQFYSGIMFWEFIPHLYFFLVRIAFEIFGYTTLVARVLSAILGVLGVYAIYLLAKELFNKRSGLIAALLLCVNFFHISYSQEIRPYGMMFLFTVLAFYRLVIFIKGPTFRNAIFYGIFAGLIVNSHFFGFITLFSQYLILLFFLIKTPLENRKKFFINSLIAGVVTLIVFLPAFQALLRVSEITSFWLQKPGAEAYTIMFREFFGNSEMVLFFINFIVIFYVINLFKEKIENYKYDTIVNNKVVFSFIILFIWLFTSLIIPLLRSYLSVPMILSRYFINIVPVLILVLAFGIDFIKSKIVKITVLSCFVIFSVIDLTVVKNYYNTPTKSQFRKLTQEIEKRNPKKSKVVTYWSWLFPYFFENDPLIKIEGKSLEDYVAGMKSASISQKAFWYADANSRPFALKPDDQAYLEQNFILKEKLEYIDAWANYYVPKKEAKVTNINGDLDLSVFEHANFDGEGNMMFFSNGTVFSPLLNLEKGDYILTINGNSLPAKPLNGENAHFKIKISGTEVGQLHVSEKPDKKENIIPFTIDAPRKVRLLLTYDNDETANGVDRNAIIYGIRIQKKK